MAEMKARSSTPRSHGALAVAGERVVLLIALLIDAFR